MSESPQQEAPAPPPRVTPEPLRRIDWLAIAPWLLLFRAPRVAASWRVWLPGAVVGIAGCYGSPALGEQSLSGIALAAFDGGAWPFTWASSYFAWVVRPGGPSFGTSYGLVFFAVFHSLLMLTMARSSAVKLVSHVGVGEADSSFRFAIHRLLRALIAIVLVFLPGLLATAIAWGIGAVGSSVLWPIVFLLSLLAAIALFAAAISVPLIIAAVAVDDADIFDAASRAVAYATQRIARLVFYVSLAAGLGFAAGVLLECVLAMQDSLMLSVVEAPHAESAQLSYGLLRAAVRGYYVAYWVSAATAIYLLLRRDIDGQPIDEMALPTDQPSESDA